ncbi:MAG: OmpH family outer membrane protein [Woeseiaceae bacterium]|nr:OmpH family outer membrane protein [Woeseiaceae bacterium]
MIDRHERLIVPFLLLTCLCVHANAQQRPSLPAAGADVQSSGTEDRAALNADRDRQLETLKSEWQQRFEEIQNDAEKDFARLKKQGYNSKDAAAVNQRRQKAIDELNREYGERRAEIYRRWSAAGQALADRGLASIRVAPTPRGPDSSPLEAGVIGLPGSGAARQASEPPDTDVPNQADIEDPEPAAEEADSPRVEPREGPLHYRLGTAFTMTGTGGAETTSWEPLRVRLPVEFRMTGLADLATREFEPIRYRVDTTFTMTGRRSETL